MKVLFISNGAMWTRNQYAWVMIALWIYSILWFALVVAVSTLWAGTLVMWIALVPLILGTPSSELFMSYERYKKWHADHFVRPEDVANDTGRSR